MDKAGSSNAQSSENGSLFFILIIGGALALVAMIPEIRDNTTLAAITTSLYSILLDALPFLLGGSLISVLIHELVPGAWIERVFRRSAITGILVASLSGMVLPLCECGIVPIIRSLLRQKVRPAVAMTAFIALPLVNPLVIASTWYAFSSRPELAWERIGLGWVAVVVIGFLLMALEKPIFGKVSSDCTCDEDQTQHDHSESTACTCSHDHDHNHEHHENGHGHTWLQRTIGILEHTIEEVFMTGRYLVVGALIAAPIQALVHLPSQANGSMLAWAWTVPAAMLLAFILSLCSTSDAFVARGFIGILGPGAITAFLLMGPFLHLRNLILLRRVLSVRAIAGFVAVVSGVVLVLGLAINLLGGGV